MELPKTFGAAIRIPLGSLLKELELIAGGQVTAFWKLCEVYELEMRPPRPSAELESALHANP